MAKKTIKQLKNLTIYDDDGRKSFKLSGVVLAYPTVIEPKVSRIAEAGSPPKYSVAVLLPKETLAEEIKALRDFILAEVKEHMKGAKLPSDKLCLRDGSDLGSEGYEPYWRLNLSANKDWPPSLRYRGQRLDREDVDDAGLLSELAVTGAHAQILGSLYLQDNQYGKRANGNLVAVNFVDGHTPLNLGSGAVTDDDDVWDDEDDL